MNWVAVGAVGELVGAVGSISIACVAVYVATRQWLDSKRISREQRELTEEIERNNEATKQEQERIVRAQSLDSYFDGISTLLMRDEDGVLTEMARNLTKGRTDSILKILKADEKRNLVAFLYGSGLISRNGADSTPVIGLSGSDLSQAELSGSSLCKAGLAMANLRGAHMTEMDLDEADLRGADLSGAILTGSELTRANLHGVIAALADMHGVDLSHADLSGADLRNIDLGGSDLSFANLSGSNLNGAILIGANLTSANLSGANLREVDLTGANLLNARLENLVSIDEADFTNVAGITEERRNYLREIASGSHPVNGVDTAESLN